MSDHENTAEGNKKANRSQIDFYARGSLSSLDWMAVGMVALTALGMLVAPAVVTPYYRSMYEDFVTELDQLPSITVFVMQIWFPLVSAMFPLALLVVALSGRRHLYLRRFLIIAAFFLGVALASLYSIGLYAPVYAIAGAVSA